MTPDLAHELDLLGVRAPRKPAPPPVDRTPREAWWTRQETCPH